MDTEVPNPLDAESEILKPSPDSATSTSSVKSRAVMVKDRAAVSPASISPKETLSVDALIRGSNTMVGLSSSSPHDRNAVKMIKLNPHIKFDALVVLIVVILLLVRLLFFEIRV